MSSAVADVGWPGSEKASMGIWARGGLTVTGLHREFADPGWRNRGKYRALKQFIMNWNNWPSDEDRAAMLDGPPHRSMTRDEKARVAAVVRCLCERDGHPVSRWVRRARPSRNEHGVRLLTDRGMGHSDTRSFRVGFWQRLADVTPASSKAYRVWLDPEILQAR